MIALSLIHDASIELDFPPKAEYTVSSMLTSVEVTPNTINGQF